MKRVSRTSRVVGMVTIVVMSFALFGHAADVDESWKSIQEMNKSVANSRNVIAACNQFMTSYPKDERTQEARKMIDNLTTTLQQVPGLIRDKGIPLANGYAINLAGAAIFGGRIDLKKEHSGLIAPNKPGEPPDSKTIEDRSIAIPKVATGIKLSEVVKLIGNNDDMFEQADGDDYQRVCIYALKDRKTALIWFDRTDTLKLIQVAGTQKTEEKKSPQLPQAFLGKWAEKGGKSQIIITLDSLSWNREDEGKEIYAADKCKVDSNGVTIAFAATEIAYWNRATGEKPRRNVDVTLTVEKGELTLTIAPSQTGVSGSGLVVESPGRKILFQRR